MLRIDEPLCVAAAEDRLGGVIAAEAIFPYQEEDAVIRELLGEPGSRP
jgi:hypothetical protein